MVDRRDLGWEKVTALAEAVKIIDGAWSGTQDFRIEFDEVLACDDRVCAVRVQFRGMGRGPYGLMEIAMGIVTVHEHGGPVIWEQFDPDDRKAMLARYAEVGGRHSVLGKPPERFYAEFLERFNAHDVDRLLELYADGWAHTDHRTMRWEDHHGPAQARDLLASAFQSVPDIQLRVDEVLAR